MSTEQANTDAEGGRSDMVDNDTRVDFYRQMVRIRAYEAALQANYHADKTPQWDIGAGLDPR